MIHIDVLKLIGVMRKGFKHDVKSSRDRGNGNKYGNFSVLLVHIKHEPYFPAENNN